MHPSSSLITESSSPLMLIHGWDKISFLPQVAQTNTSLPLRPVVVGASTSSFEQQAYNNFEKLH
jgi:hypothetical protein